jgi:hypothetical protein
LTSLTMAVTRSQATAKPITQAAINTMLPFPSGSRNIDIVTILYGLHTICAARLVAISRLSSSAPLYVKTGGIRKKIIQSKAVWGGMWRRIKYQRWTMRGKGGEIAH